MIPVRLVRLSVAMISVAFLVSLLGCQTGAVPAPQVGDGSGAGGGGAGGGGGSNGGDSSAMAHVDLNVVKLLNYAATTERGPAVGDGVIAFDADRGSSLAWVRVGETQAFLVPPPDNMDHHRSAFAFAGKKLVARDRYSGSLWVFDTDSLEQATAIPAASVNMGGSVGPNLWSADGDFIATVNSSVTSQDGPGKVLKIVNVSDVTNMTVTPIDVSPDNAVSAISLDAAAGRFAVRAGFSMYVYLLNALNEAPTRFDLPAEVGGTGSRDIHLDGDRLAFFDDNDNFSILEINEGVLSKPNRNPGRDNAGTDLDGDVFAYFGTQTEDDGSGIAIVNRALIGNMTTPTEIVIDPAGTFVNADDESDGRVGFGSSVAVAGDGRFVFVAGDSGVGVGDEERLYVSADGGDFMMVADADDPLNALRAAGVAANDGVVAFLIPMSLDGFTSNVSVGYAVLPLE